MDYKTLFIEMIDKYEKEHKLHNIVWEYAYRFMKTKLKGGS